MLHKTIILDGTDDVTGQARTLHIDRRDTGLRKYASCCGEALDMIRAVQPDPGRSIVLVIAMSASEFYGPNRNGDGFSEGPVSAMMFEGPQAGRVVELVREGEQMPAHLGSFLRGHNFLHHNNQDPAKAVGKVLAAFYNWQMHRPELVLDVDNSRAARFGERIASGERPPVSMGTTVAYDVCTTCGNRAPSRASYCEHVRDMFSSDGQNGMCTIRPDGVQHYVLNPSPKFFDISWVFKPADRIAYTVEAAGQAPVMAVKQASAYEVRGAVTEALDPFYFAVQDAAALFDRAVSGAYVPHVKVSSASAPLDLARVSQIFEAARGQSSWDVLSTFARLNKMGSDVLVQDVYAGLCAARGEAMRADVAQMLPAAQGLVLHKAARNYGLCRELAHIDNANGGYLPGVAAPVLLGPEKTASLYGEELMRHYVPEAAGVLADPNAYYGRTLEPLTVVDPRDGSVRQTTMSAAEKTDLANLKTRMGEAGAIAAMTGAAFTAARLLRGKSTAARIGQVPIALGGGALTYGAATNDAPQIQTLEGVSIPSNTPTVRARLDKSAAAGLAQRVRNDTATEIAVAQNIARGANVALHLGQLAPTASAR